MSHMKEVAKILGVEIGEKFKVDANGVVLQKNFFFTDYGLFVTGGAGPMAGILNDLLNGEYKVIKLFSEPILDDEEKEYLSTVIKPFRNEVKYVVKDCDEFGPYLAISRHNNKPATIIPIKDPEIDYIGMEAGKDYSLDELFF